MTSEVQKRSTLQSVAIVFISLIFVAACTIGVTLAFSGGEMFAGKKPTNLGVQAGKLTPCPNTPNCVNSQAQDSTHGIEPLKYTSTLPKAMADLKTVIQNMEKTNIITETENYLYAEFTSKLMGFVDDVEFFFGESANTIQVRSASRLGRSDLDVNRKRIETIRGQLNELQNPV
ncbi:MULTISPECIES: DUF1499 domain-containing protein [unclassified Coleofasciculus]|uniref:DUF1499 domain-containing protein n=1 Tax=unclassified Coleofasciculus TaxID=2692782 RepID=UPI001881074E|nr:MULTISPECIES: DUF1499 domain-containing protein [unclassified Coleofasciculus]MBE9125368.1 DUF1499 domain-containing protein [Coleofasciculus sp. LEGE 07081]MBE9147415.1 DUF1499 domain-containing protein [Coleofasciculus sp. LEGE 07092]